MPQSQYNLNKWRHPQTDQVRIYLNGLDTTTHKVWFERGERKGDVLPPVYEVKYRSNDPNPLTEEVLREIAEAFSEMDLFLSTITWERLNRAASW